MEIKGVIFDLDGTLIDSLETYTKAFNQGVARFKLSPISKEELAAFLNRALGMRKILAERYLFLSAETIAECNEEIVKAYLNLYKEGVTLKPGAKEVLTQLKEMGLRIGIVTGRTTLGEEKWLELRRLGIDQFIEAIITGADAPRKPAPDGIIKCLQELGLSPEECVFVGDSQADIITGKGAGVFTVAIPSGVAKEEILSKEGPEAMINDLTELPFRILGIKAKQDL
jgi:phosphoglycolate phosphatase